MAVLADLKSGQLSEAKEQLFCKSRWEYRKINDHNGDVVSGFEDTNWIDLEDDEKLRKAMEDASLRQSYDPVKGTMDMSKKRVTDSVHNSHVHLPGEVKSEQETFINLRRTQYTKVENTYLHENTKNGR